MSLAEAKGGATNNFAGHFPSPCAGADCMCTSLQYRAFQRFKNPKFPRRTDAAAPAVPHWDSHSVEQAAVFSAITASLGPESRVADAAGCRCLESRSSLGERRAPWSGARSRSAASRGCPARTTPAPSASSTQLCPCSSTGITHLLIMALERNFLRMVFTFLPPFPPSF